MDWSKLFELIGGLVSLGAAIGGGWWAIEKWRKRDEHFPRIDFEVTAKFVGQQNGETITEILAVLENKGFVPLEIQNFSFRLLGLSKTDRLEKGDETIRRQLHFPHILDEGWFVPETWGGTFVYPGVKTEYNFITSIPKTISFIRIQADFNYMKTRRSHHVAKVLKVIAE